MRKVRVETGLSAAWRQNYPLMMPRQQRLDTREVAERKTNSVWGVAPACQ